MKKKNLICIILCVAFLLCSCSKASEKEPAVLDPYVPSETELNGTPEQETQPEEKEDIQKPVEEEPKEDLPGLKLLSKEEVDGETVFRYEEQDYSGIPTRHMENALIVGWNNKFSSMLNKLENDEGGLVVVGHATGVRESHFKKGYTKTQFVVEQVILGEESDEVIAVREDYTYREDEQGGYFYSLTDSNLNHTGVYVYSQGKIMIHLTLDYKNDGDCATPGKYLRYHRTLQGLTTRELAEKVGIVPATLVLYENDHHPMKYNTAVALAQELNIDRSRLLDEYTTFVDYPCAAALKKVRTELSLSQAQFSKEIGVAQSAYSRWERGAGNPRRQEYNNIVTALKRRNVDIGSITYPTLIAQDM